MPRTKKAVWILLFMLIIILTIYYTQQEKPVLADKRLEDIVRDKPRTLRVRLDNTSTGETIQKLYTCDGPNKTPTITVENTTKGKYLALIMYDPDAPHGTFIHWLAIEPAQNGRTVFPERDMINGTNSYGHTRYDGPCPPHGETHRYFILILELDTKPALNNGYTLDQLLAKTRDHTTSWGYTYIKYRR